MRRPVFLLFFTFLCGALLAQPIQRAFRESGGTLSTGQGGAISSLSDGDIVVVNERWTNFSQKGLQCFVLDKGTLEVKRTTAFYINQTLTAIQVVVKGDTIYAAARLSTGSDYSVLLMAFTRDLKLIFSKEWRGAKPYLYYSFLAHPSGGFVLFGVTDPGTASTRFFTRVNESGEILWVRNLNWNPFVWGQAVVMPNGDIIGTGGGDFVTLNANGDFVRASRYSSFEYVIGTGVSLGKACFGRHVFNEVHHYGLLLGSNGEFSGVTQGIKIKDPAFFHVRPNGNMVYGSSLIRQDTVLTQLSEFGTDGKLIATIGVDNVFGLAPTGAERDVCRYAVHSDNAGNMYVLGVANRSGFYVWRLGGDNLDFACAEKSKAAEPTPVPEPGNAAFQAFPLPDQTTPFALTEETPGTFATYCTKCDIILDNFDGDTSVCSTTGSIDLDARNPGASYEWSDGSTGRTLTVKNSGTYVVRIQNRCSIAYDTIVVELVHKPKIKINASATLVMPQEPVFLTGSPDTFDVMNWYYHDSLLGPGSTYTWTPTRNGRYWITWQAEASPWCVTRDSIELHVSLIDYYIPTAFTPNGNGLNDGWGPKGSGISHLRMQIHNRWGECVFDEENQLWDGNFRGKAVMTGWYVYRIFITDDDGVLRQHSGYLWVLQ